jgi:hypothetical protein
VNGEKNMNIAYLTGEGIFGANYRRFENRMSD